MLGWHHRRVQPCPFGRRRQCQAPRSPRYCATTCHCPRRALIGCISTATWPGYKRAAVVRVHVRSAGQLHRFAGHPSRTPGPLRPSGRCICRSALGASGPDAASARMMWRFSIEPSVHRRGPATAVLIQSNQADGLAKDRGLFILASVTRGQALLLLSARRRAGTSLHRVGTYVPYRVRVCLNGNEWLKQQLLKEAIPFDSPWTTASCGARTRTAAAVGRLTQPGRRAGVFRSLAPALAFDPCLHSALEVGRAACGH